MYMFIYHVIIWCTEKGTPHLYRDVMDKQAKSASGTSTRGSHAETHYQDRSDLYRDPMHKNLVDEAIVDLALPWVGSWGKICATNRYYTNIVDAPPHEWMEEAQQRLTNPDIQKPDRIKYWSEVLKT